MTVRLVALSGTCASKLSSGPLAAPATLPGTPIQISATDSNANKNVLIVRRTISNSLPCKMHSGVSAYQLLLVGVGTVLPEANAPLPVPPESGYVTCTAPLASATVTSSEGS